ncbi:MAG TPA: tripartite tricarboxylate transporter substrate binding protein [Burkholderiales bacterium]|nr:tripartite tricarboxylate transporter substrate binding protein [Burkholderiales bacterium]
MTTTLAAAGYPEKPIRIVVVYPPGGGIDILARALGQKLSDAWGQPIIVDNRPGAGTTIGAAIVAKAAPDGYTLLATDVSYSITPSLYGRELPYDPLKDLAPIVLLNLVTDVLVVHPSLPVKSVKELIAYAKANPGKILYASAGNGTLNHLAPEMFKAMAGIDMVHVPYKGAVAAVADVMSGREQVYIGALASTVPHIKSGRLRALAITGARRSQVLPELPTVIEAGLAGYDVNSWYGLLAPAGTPRPIIDKVNDEVRKALRTSDIQERLAADGSVAVGGSPKEFGSFIAAEMKKWGKVVKSAGAKVD